MCLLGTQNQEFLARAPMFRSSNRVHLHQLIFTLSKMAALHTDPITYHNPLCQDQKRIPNHSLSNEYHCIHRTPSSDSSFLRWGTSKRPNFLRNLVLLLGTILF